MSWRVIACLPLGMRLSSYPRTMKLVFRHDAIRVPRSAMLQMRLRLA